MSALKFLILNILKYMEVYTPQEVSHFFLVKFPVECRQNHVWGPIFVPSYDHIYQSMYFAKVQLGDTHG